MEESKTSLSNGLALIEQKMRAAGLSDLCIKIFKHYYKKLAEGESGMIPEDSIEPLVEAPDLEKLGDRRKQGVRAMPRAVIIKLNGGLGTSMGLSEAKSLLPAKNGMSFLEIIARQALFLRKKHEVSLPLIFMNSFNTEQDTLEELGKLPELAGGQPDIGLSFVQNRVPKILQENLLPAEWPAAPVLEWCPPGHGDIYTALVQSGLLDRLIASGLEYAFISNADNLGAFFDLNLLGYFAESRAPFLMEVADRTEADKKGGHVARAMDGRLLLRESAQCPPEQISEFQNVDKHRYFNTNSIWIRLSALQSLIDSQQGILDLPLIRNSKTIDPADEGSPRVYHLESAMGAAISVFEDAEVIRVPRSRFIPIKTTNDLIALWSDIFLMNESFQLVKNTARRHGTIVVRLDPLYYKNIQDFNDRFPKGAPSLVDCTRLMVDGDFRFGENVILRGEVALENESSGQKLIPDGVVVSG